MRTLRFACGLGAFLLTSASAPAQNLIVNGDFQTFLTGWQATGQGSATWSPLDFTMTATSGSARVLNADPAEMTRLNVLRQCLILSAPSHAYRFGASGYIPSGQVAGRLVFAWGARINSPDCTGGAIGLGGFFLTAIDAWQSKEMVLAYSSALPSGTSIEILLGVEKDPQGGNFAGHYDAVYVIADGIFAHPFES